MANSDIANFVGLPERPHDVTTPYGTFIARRVSAFLKNDKCRPWCNCGWEGRERNLTDENYRKAAEDCRAHRRPGRCKLA